MLKSFSRAACARSRFAGASAAFATIRKSAAVSSDIPSMMRAAQIERHGTKLDVLDVPVPEVETGKVLVKIHTSGVCHTDVHAGDNKQNTTTIAIIN